jgi:hypothetical protein
MRLLPENDDAAANERKLFEGFVPFLFSGSGDVTAEVVFVGYGISAPSSAAMITRPRRRRQGGHGGARRAE